MFQSFCDTAINEQFTSDGEKKRTSTSLSMISGSAGRLAGRVTDDCTN